MAVNYEAYYESVVDGLDLNSAVYFYKADTFPTIQPVHWLTSHFAVGGFSPIRIEHQALNLSNEFSWVIQIWFLTELEYRALPRLD